MEHFLRKLEARKAEDNDQIRYKRRKEYVQYYIAV